MKKSIVVSLCIMLVLCTLGTGEYVFAGEHNDTIVEIFLSKPLNGQEDDGDNKPASNYQKAMMEDVVLKYFSQLQEDGAYEIVESYDNFQIISVHGPKDGTYIVYVAYDYKYRDFDSVVPGLTEIYLAADEDGQLHLQETISEEEIKYIEEVRQSDEIQSLIQTVQEKYQKVLDKDPELAKYISGS